MTDDVAHCDDPLNPYDPPRVDPTARGLFKIRGRITDERDRRQACRVLDEAFARLHRLESLHQETAWYMDDPWKRRKLRLMCDGIAQARVLLTRLAAEFRGDTGGI